MLRLSMVSIGVLGIAAVLTGCPEEPVAYSETVSLKLSGMKEGDVKNNELSEEKNVNSESGNPYGAFVKAATDALGRSPGRIAPTSAFLRIHSDSTGVTGFEEIFTSMELFFSDSATTIPVGTVDAPQGSSVEVPLDDVNLEALHDSMVGGDFKVGVRGPTQATTRDKFELRISIDIIFEAYESAD